MNYDDEEEAPLVTLTFVTSGKVIEAPAQSILLRMSIRHQGGLPFKCGGGICGTCFCLIEKGIENTGPLTVKEKKMLTEEEIAKGHRLGCQTTFTGPLSVSWIPLDQRDKPGREPQGGVST